MSNIPDVIVIDPDVMLIDVRDLTVDPAIANITVGVQGPPGPPGGPTVVAVPYANPWPPPSPLPNILYLRLAP